MLNEKSFFENLRPLSSKRENFRLKLKDSIRESLIARNSNQKVKLSTDMFMYVLTKS
ncbi:hypothetical protein NIES23_22370 [Trichormus variabilis NIES-23]|uniref:Uncharacterized protein n=1 Tax=Trichormus variabilis NIES-23 TaxID=1973479 RepID=A0A1Z4KKK0_ANAVA|nr:hypothetical protein NIES23_22370 [Trichormus variabilis NIES-23]